MTAASGVTAAIVVTAAGPTVHRRVPTAPPPVAGAEPDELLEIDGVETPEGDLLVDEVLVVDEAAVEEDET